MKRINPIVLGYLCFISPLLGSDEDGNRGLNKIGLIPLNRIQEFTGCKKNLSAVVGQNIRARLLDHAAFYYADAVVKDQPIPEHVKEQLRHVKSDEEIQDLKQSILSYMLFIDRVELSEGLLSLLIKARPMPPFLKDFFEKVTGEEIDEIIKSMIKEGSVLNSARLYLRRNVHLYKLPNQSDEKIKEDIVIFAKTFMTLEDALKEADSSNIPNRIVATKAELQNTEIINNFFKQHPNKTLVLDMGDAQGIKQNDFPNRLVTVKNLAVVGRNLTKIGSYAFSCLSSLQSIVIPDIVRSIGDHAFEGCCSLQSIVIPHGVTLIGDGTFSGCNSLQSIAIPDSVRSIEDHAFSHCNSLQSIVIPDSVRSIGHNAFFGCSSLQSIVILHDVESIGRHAFYYCTSLQSIVVGRNSYAESHIKRTYPALVQFLVYR